MSLKTVWDLLKQTGLEWMEDKVPRLGAALAFYSVLSLAPLLVIAIAIAGLVFGEEAARGQVVEQMGGLVGKQGAEAIQTMIANARKPESGIIAAVIGVASLLFAATGVFGELHDAMNTIWEVQPKPGGGVMGFIKDRFLSFTMVLGIAFLLLVSLVLTTALAATGKYLSSLVPFAAVMQVLNFVISFAVITLLFAMMFKLLPDVKIGWSDVWIGAVITGLLFTLGKLLIGLYLGHSSIGSAYGAAGSFVVLLVWVYYSSQILFFGAEFTQVYADKYGSRIVAAEGAEPVTDEARAKQGIPRTDKPRAEPPEAKPRRQEEAKLRSDANVRLPRRGAAPRPEPAEPGPRWSRLALGGAMVAVAALAFLYVRSYFSVVSHDP